MTIARRVFAAPSTKIAGVVLLLVLLLTITGGLLAPNDPLAQDVPNQFEHPSAGHLLGTDYLGRDTLSRLIAGTRVTILGAFATVALGFLLGVLPGIVSAFLGRTSEFFVMRTVDALLTLPIIVLAVAATGLFSNGTGAVIIAVGVLLAPRFFRIARAETLGFASEQYVEAAAAVRRLALLDHPPPHLEQGAADAGGHLGDLARLRGPRPLQPRLPRHRREGAGAELGRHALLRRPVPLPGLDGGALAGAGDRDHGLGLQRGGRRSPRRPRRPGRRPRHGRASRRPRTISIRC